MTAQVVPLHSDRKAFLGGSDAAAVLGVSPWSTPLDVYLEKTGQAVKEADPARERLFKRGKRLEPIVVDMLIDELGIKVTKRSTPQEPNRYVDPEHIFLGVEIDFEWEVQAADVARWDLDPALIGTTQNGEVKTVHPWASAKFGEEGTEETPIEYAAQAMDGLMVTGRKLTMFGVLVGADELSVYWIKRDDDTIREMRPRLVSFWRDHVLAGVPPQPVNLPDVLKLFRKLPASTTEATPEILAIYQEFERAKQVAVVAEDWQIECKYQIGQFILGESGILLGNKGKLEPTASTKPGKHLLTDDVGEILLTVGLQSQSRIDNDRLRKERPEIAFEFQKSISFFRFDRPRKK